MDELAGPVRSGRLLARGKACFLRDGMQLMTMRNAAPRALARELVDGQQEVQILCHGAYRRGRVGPTGRRGRG